jgi:hypothetical protein
MRHIQRKHGRAWRQAGDRIECHEVGDSGIEADTLDINPSAEGFVLNARLSSNLGLQALYLEQQTRDTFEATLADTPWRLTQTLQALLDEATCRE